MLLGSVVLACLLVTASADKCCFPDQWEGFAGFVHASRDMASGTDHYSEGSQMISADTTTKSLVLQQKLIYDGQYIEQTMYLNYSAGMTFLYNNGSCFKAPVSFPLLQCIPDDAESNNFYYGLSDEKLDVSGFQINLSNLTLYLVVTSDTCVPVAEIALGLSDGSAINSNVAFSNITSGIKDKSIFTMPAACKAAQLAPATFSEVRLLIETRKSWYMYKQELCQPYGARLETSRPAKLRIIEVSKVWWLVRSPQVGVPNLIKQ